MNTIYRLFTGMVLCLLINFSVTAQIKNDSNTHDLSITILKKYINLPISHSVERSNMSFEADGKPLVEFVVRLAPSKPDYWVFYDVSAYKGKVFKIKYTGNPEGMKKIYQDDVIAGNDSLYHEYN